MTIPVSRRLSASAGRRFTPSLKKSDSYLASQSKLISKSAAANFKLWKVKEKLRSYHIVKGSWSKEVSYLRSWTKSRISWMNRQYR